MLTSLAISLLISYFLTPLNGRLALLLGAVDKPDKRRINTDPIPTLGGLAIYCGVMLSLLFCGILAEFSSIFIGGTLIVILGIIDDLYEMPALYKLTGQIIISLIVINFGVKIESINSVQLGILSIPVTLFWLLGAVNVINLIDGLDGLAGGVTVIAAFTLSIFAYQQGQIIVVGITAALIGAVLGFLKYNFNPAQIFMGDTGSMFLGLMLGIISIIGALKTVTVVTFIVPVLALGVPIVDTAFVILRRRLTGKSIFKADKEHLHHKLLNFGLAQHQAAVVVYLINIFLGLMALGISQANLEQGLFLLVVTVSFLLIGNYKAEILKLN